MHRGIPSQTKQMVISDILKNCLCVSLSHRMLSLFCQIKVAVSADRDCIRAYQPQISSTNYNTLTLNVKTQEPDNLLFYLGSSTSVSEGPWVFVWDYRCFLGDETINMSILKSGITFATIVMLNFK